MELGRLSRLQLYGIVSSTCFVWAVVNAFRVRSNFYSAAVYLSKSNACMMILWNQGIYQTVLFGKLMQAIFFGELRMIEVERLQERGWFAVTETLLALTIFKDEFESSFVLLFVSLLFLKVFHWLASDRVEMMEQSAQVTRLAHARMLGLLSILWVLDACLIVFAVESILLEGPTVMIMFASEYMILLATVWSITMKYIINCIDLRSEVPWEDKSVWGLYVDLAADFFKLVNYITFFALILTFYGLPLNILRDVYITLRSFILKCRDLARYRAATRNMDTLYPDATLAEMDAMADKTCIICREDMEFRGQRPVAEGEEPAPPPPPPVGPNDTPKKLPCGHVFHFHCLRSWLERQQSCPTCRRPVLPSERGAAAPAPAPNVNPLAAAAGGGGGGGRGVPPAAVGDEAIRQAQLNLARNLGREAFGVVFPGIPFPPEAALPAGAAPPPPPAQAGPPPAATPGTPLPPGAQPTPTPSTSAPRRGTSSPRTAPTSAGAGLDNPLARFSLPELRLPPTGEAGLYNAPPSPLIAPGYAGVAYGAYPQASAGPSAGPSAPRVAGQPTPGTVGTVGQARSVPNLEERIQHIRDRLARAQGAAAATAATPGAGSGASRAAGSSVSVSVAPGTPVAMPSSPVASSGKVDEEKEEEEEKPEISAREAALAAAERRAAAANGGRTPTRGSPTPTLSPTSPSPPATSVSPPPIDALPSASSTASPSPSPIEEPIPATATESSSTTPSPVAAQPTAPTQQPRLVPLFSANSPLPLASYPSLLSALPPSFAPSPTPYSLTRPRTLPSQPLIPTSPTSEQLHELSRLTRRGIEERLRVLMGWQERMQSMAEEMKSVLEVLPLDTEAEAAEETEMRNSKGKTPVEGIHAPQGGM
ncbi:hypothetical protein BCR35DRAFT_300503 [Leucosporidium creatinivorum]|uniref:RING-type E3 ubiquitin transferase n=1 Tax=Leucosporidium creatinivorum TaxID=106004 RepID=A0A1Y2FZ53_9BASI|nr:hypothetical protein BCR35DRAFT_300503 [Leucosporidium creatinivorum]